MKRSKIVICKITERKRGSPTTAITKIYLFARMSNCHCRNILMMWCVSIDVFQIVQYQQWVRQPLLNNIVKSFCFAVRCCFDGCCCCFSFILLCCSLVRLLARCSCLVILIRMSLKVCHMYIWYICCCCCFALLLHKYAHITYYIIIIMIRKCECVEFCVCKYIYRKKLTQQQWLCDAASAATA